jgi:hypothetical protein
MNTEDKDAMQKRMTNEEIDHWFEVVDETTAEYGVLVKVIIEDLHNPDTPQIIKDYLADLDALITDHRKYWQSTKESGSE